MREPTGEFCFAKEVLEEVRLKELKGGMKSMEKNEELKTEQSEEIEQTADLMLTGDMVENMKNKHFTVLAADAVLVADFKNPQLKRKKILLTVELGDIEKSKVTLFCNPTSQKVIAASKGLRLLKWAGYKGEFKVLTQMVGDKEKKVLYVK